LIQTVRGADAPFLWIGGLVGILIFVAGMAMCRDDIRHNADKTA
jgi:hypothetical protein